MDGPPCGLPRLRARRRRGGARPPDRRAKPPIGTEGRGMTDALGTPGEAFWEDHYRGTSAATSGRPSAALGPLRSGPGTGPARSISAARGATTSCGSPGRAGTPRARTSRKRRSRERARTPARAGVANRARFERHDLSLSLPEGRFDLVAGDVPPLAGRVLARRCASARRDHGRPPAACSCRSPTPRPPRGPGPTRTRSGPPPRRSSMRSGSRCGIGRAWPWRLCDARLRSRTARRRA